MKIKKGDTVRVITGRDKGVEGIVAGVDPGRKRVLVEGVNVAKRHTKPTQANQQGGIIEKIMPIHASNLAVVCPRTKEAGRVGYRMEGNTKVRYHKKSGDELS
jgi:large subunit ribosomal protein L24